MWKTSEIGRKLNLSRDKLDQWLSRGILVLDHDAESGASPVTLEGRMARRFSAETSVGNPPATRQWTIGDAIRAVVLDRLSELGMPLGEIQRHIHGLHGFKDDRAFLVIKTGRLGALIPSTERGSPPPRESDLRRFHARGLIYADIVRESRLLETIRDPNVFVAVTLCLDDIEELVKNRLEVDG